MKFSSSSSADAIEAPLVPSTHEKTAADAKASALGNSASLDQWRGLALVLVLLSHGLYFTGRVHGIGRVGVNLFFFISGILVFRSLAKQRGATHWERGRGFLKRRLKRLYPAMATFVVAMAPVVFLLQNRPDLPAHSDFPYFLKLMPAAMVYLMNYVPPNLSLGHLWSVSCEMQFYMLAPLIFFLGGGTTRRQNLLWGTLLLLLVLSSLCQPFFGDDKKYHFEFAVWPMMFGYCCEYQKCRLQELSRRWGPLLIKLCLGLLGASLLLMLFGLGFKKLVIATGAFVFIPCFLMYLSGEPMPGWTGRILAWIGERTYSIYLWQQPFTICGYLPAFLHPLGAIAAVFIGGAWFHWFERPFLSTARRQWMDATPLS